MTMSYKNFIKNYNHTHCAKNIINYTINIHSIYTLLN